MTLEQYQIVLVNLDPTVSSEIRKTRPCVIVSPDEINRFLQTVIIAPMTHKSRAYPTRVSIKNKGEPGWIVIDQLRTMDKKRVIKAVGKLSRREIRQTKSVLYEMLVE
jgi:mRNA interferase MazF